MVALRRGRSSTIEKKRTWSVYARVSSLHRLVGGGMRVEARRRKGRKGKTRPAQFFSAGGEV
jgi:hypothetical protein